MNIIRAVKSNLSCGNQSKVDAINQLFSNDELCQQTTALINHVLKNQLEPSKNLIRGLEGKRLNSYKKQDALLIKAQLQVEVELQIDDNIYILDKNGQLWYKKVPQPALADQFYSHLCPSKTFSNILANCLVAQLQSIYQKIVKIDNFWNKNQQKIIEYWDLQAKVINDSLLTQKEKDKKLAELNKKYYKYDFKKYQYELLQKWKTRTLKSKFGYLDITGEIVQIQNSNTKKFKYWIQIDVRNGSDKIYLPLKEHKHFRKLESKGYQLNRDYIRLYPNSNKIQLVFSKQSVPKPKVQKTANNTLGVDVGEQKAIVTSNGEFEIHGKVILEQARNVEWGSNEFNKLRNCWRQVVDEFVNEIDFTGISFLVLENLNGMKVGRSVRSRDVKNRIWSYSYIHNRLMLKAEELGIEIIFIDPRYTSQTCSGCGNKDPGARKGELYSCKNTACGMIMDADLNAALNIRDKGIVK